MRKTRRTKKRKPTYISKYETKSGKRYRVRVTYNGKLLNLGSFPQLKQAKATLREFNEMLMDNQPQTESINW